MVVGCACVLAVMAPAFAAGEVTRVEIAMHQDVLAGRSFGSSGRYEELTGQVFIAVNPADPRNGVIADLNLAPRNTEGRPDEVCHDGRRAGTWADWYDGRGPRSSW